MKILKNSLLIAGIIFTLMLLGCSDNGPVYPDQKASASGVTSSSGEVTLDLGSHVITVSTVNESGANISGMNVRGYLLQDYLALYASGNGTYYPTCSYISYDSLAEGSGEYFAPKPATSQSSSAYNADVELVMYSIDREIYSFLDEPASVEDAYNDPWLNYDTRIGTVDDVYAQIDLVDFEGGVIIHIADNVAALINADIQSVAVPIAQVTDPAVFDVYLGLIFHVFDQDTLTYSLLDYDGESMPVISIDDIIPVDGSFFMQFTLIWGQNPGDLDSHLWTPTIENERYHIYYGSPGNISVAPYAFLDVDDVTSWGPEHVIIGQGFPGNYAYAVHHFSGSSDIPNSDAEVTILRPDRSVEKFDPPSGTAASGWYWYVCNIDGETGEVTPVNTLSADPPYTWANGNQLPAKAH